MKLKMKILTCIYFNLIQVRSFLYEDLNHALKDRLALTAQVTSNLQLAHLHII